MASEEDILHAGKQAYLIKAFKTVTINVKTSAGLNTIQLLDMALMPGFLTNLVALRKIINAGIDWDSRNNRLHRNGKTLCYTTDVDDHWVLEYQSAPALSAFATSRAPRASSEGTAKRWHAVMAYAGSEAIAHLQRAVTGATVTG
jgi:hypothetical protein